jgi:hypothetical protein
VAAEEAVVNLGGSLILVPRYPLRVIDLDILPRHESGHFTTISC